MKKKMLFFEKVPKIVTSTYKGEKKPRRLLQDRQDEVSGENELLANRSQKIL